MNKFFRFAATLTGAIALVTGFTACGKDDDSIGSSIGKEGVECCSYTGTGIDDGQSYTYTYIFCEDGTYVYSNSDGDYETGYWTEYWDTTTDWDDMKSYMQSEYGAKCD